MRTNGEELCLALLAGLAVLAQGSMAHADQYPGHLRAAPIISQTMLTGSGETYPGFDNDGRPIMSERLIAGSGGETYPAFANPTNGGQRSDYAAIGMASGGAQEYARLGRFNHEGG